MEGKVLHSHCFVDIDRFQLMQKLGPRKIRLRMLLSFLAAVSGPHAPLPKDLLTTRVWESRFVRLHQSFEVCPCCPRGMVPRLGPHADG